MANGPADFVDVDEAICKALGVEADPDHYHALWYDIIGLQLALGKSLDWLLGRYWFNPTYGPIVNYLHQNYTADAWWESK